MSQVDTLKRNFEGQIQDVNRSHSEISQSKVLLWVCPICSVLGGESSYCAFEDEFCACGGGRDANIIWRCDACCKENPISQLSCPRCTCHITPESFNAYITVGWQCNVCSNRCNVDLNDRCTLCQTPRPGRYVGHINICETVSSEGVRFSEIRGGLPETEDESPALTPAVNRPTPQEEADLRWVCCRPNTLSTEICSLCSTPRFTWLCNQEHECEIWQERCAQCDYKRPEIFTTHNRLINLSRV